MTDHSNATEWQNRAERAEQFAGELQAKIDALQQHAEAMAELLSRYRQETPLGNQPHMIAHKAAEALANWTAWLLDGGEA